MDVSFSVGRVFSLMLPAKVSSWLFLLGVECIWFIPGEKNIDPIK